MDKQSKIQEKPLISRKQHLSKLCVHRERNRERVKHTEWDTYSAQLVLLVHVSITTYFQRGEITTLFN